MRIQINILKRLIFLFKLRSLEPDPIENLFSYDSFKDLYEKGFDNVSAANKDQNQIPILMHNSKREEIIFLKTTSNDIKAPFKKSFSD